MAKEKNPVKRASKAPVKKNAKPGFFARTKEFFHGVVLEFKKVNWPSGKELTKHTMVVIGIVALFTAVIYLFDVVLGFVKGLFM